jgi:outer membrane scaffolding protein for murein synthesis (MipA/OmpV family)
MFEPDRPEFRVIFGIGSDIQPVYDGSRAYRVLGGPVINVQFKDIAFISTGDGIGYNLVHKRGLQLGVGIAYNRGRKGTRRLHRGSIADLGAYFPLPGSSSHLAMFLGPSITVADKRYLQDLYGVTNQQSASSRHVAYSIGQSGIEAAGLGFSATWTLSRHYLLNIDAAINHLAHLASDSPLVERASGHVVALSFDYTW